jgi:peptidyl-prolyl cis-trans isomerase NIMA-interacting 1
MVFTRPLFPAVVIVAVTACTVLTEPPSSSVGPPARPANPTAGATAAPQPAQPNPVPTPAPAPTPADQGATVAASHILVAYAGALRADPNIKRTKEEAKTRAEGLMARARKGDDFAKLADEGSDDPSAKMNHGALGRFTKDRMVKPFADAAFALRPGDVSTLVETPFGFHVIKRTE